MIEIRSVQTAEDILFCSRAILSLRPMVNAEMLVEQTQRMMRQGFEMLYIANNNNTSAAAVAGYRTFEMYRMGKTIYIDDLFSLPESRGKGFAGALLDHIYLTALNAGIKTVHIDSGYDLHPGHSLFLNRGYILPCHHFVKIIVD